MFPIFSQIISEYFLDRDDSNNTKGYAFFLGRHLLTIEGIVQGFQDQDQPLCWTLKKTLLTWIQRQKQKENPLFGIFYHIRYVFRIILFYLQHFGGDRTL